MWNAQVILLFSHLRQKQFRSPLLKKKVIQCFLSNSVTVLMKALVFNKHCIDI